MASVLIIDGDKRLAASLQEQLFAQGFEVVVTHRAEEGLQQALKSRPDLILMDANMPDATGFQMSKRFRENEITRSVPIVMMSPLAGYPNQQAFAMERGVNEFIPKPIQVFQLGEVVDRYIGYKPPPASQYSASTDVHKALSTWLGKALTREEEEKNFPPSQR